MNLDISSIIGIVGGFIGVAAYINTSRIGALKTRIDELQARVSELTQKLLAVETERDSARREITSHYTARLEVSDENRELHRAIEKKSDALIDLQRQVLELQKVR